MSREYVEKHLELHRSIREETRKIQEFIRANPDDTTADRKARIDMQAAVDNHVAATQRGRWTPQRINDWQDSIFGLTGRDPLAKNGVMKKLEDEVGELRLSLEDLAERPDDDGSWEKTCKEAADVYITLVHLCGVVGIDLERHVAAKMDINEAREWNVNKDGSGQHRD